MTAAMSKEQIKAAADRAEARARGKTAAEEFVEAALSEAEIDAEIVKLAALPIGVYESSRVAASKRLRMRASILDSLVSAKRTKPKKDEEINFLPHWNVEPWQDPVDGGALLQDLCNHFKRYVVLPKQADVALALWVLHTWVFDCFDITPYLAITAHQALRQDRAHDHALLAVPPSQEKRLHEQGVDLSKR
jgi:hypothetical protein